MAPRLHYRIKWKFLLLNLFLMNTDCCAKEIELFKPEYWSWFYRWHRGAAWLFHESTHPCLNSSNVCSFSQVIRQEQACKLYVNTTLVSHMDSVELRPQLNEYNMSAGDFIGVYCTNIEEQNSDMMSIKDYADFCDYVLMPLNDTSVAIGPLVNARGSYQFRYLQKTGDNKYKVIAESALVEMERGPSEPLQIRLALTDNPGEMRIMWTTGRVWNPFVQYGVEIDALDHFAMVNNATDVTSDAAGTTYDASDMCHEPATTRSSMYYMHPGYTHDAVMSGLQSGQTYFYRTGSKTGVSSAVYNFTLPPLKGESSTTSPQSFIIFGDLGSSVLEPRNVRDSERSFFNKDLLSRPKGPSDKRTVMQRVYQDIRSKEYDYLHVLHIGDLSYAKGKGFMWDQFGAIIEPIASHIPYHVGIGNHEYDYTVNGLHHDPSGGDASHSNGWHPKTGNFGNDSNGECGVPTARRFHMPDNGNGVFWYSFSIGLVHHIVISSEHRCERNAPMIQWLMQELQSVDRSVTPWLVLYLHRPLYCSEYYLGDFKVTHILRACLEDLIAEQRVDIVFSGHYHAYERTCPVHQGECYTQIIENDQEEAHAPTHIMIGSAGAEVDDMTYLSRSYSVNRQEEYGYGRLHVYNGTHALFEFVRARDRNISDSHWIISSHKWDPHPRLN